MMKTVAAIMKPGVVAQMFPDVGDELTPEIAGFGWFQGWNDGNISHGVALVLIEIPHVVCVHRLQPQRHGSLRNEHGEFDQGREKGVECPTAPCVDCCLRFRRLL
jgi:hypothetical protein